MFVWASKFVAGLKRRVVETNLDNLMWLFDIIPTLLGFSIRNDKISGQFWCVHLSLLFYIYGVGSASYQLELAVKSEDFIKSNVNIVMMILIINMSWWWISKRPILRTILKGIEESEHIAETVASENLKKKHLGYLRKIKIIIIIINLTQLFDALFLYIPHRLDIQSSYSMGMVSCVGLDAITATYNKGICMIIIFAQESCLIITAQHYQTVLVFVIAHTAGMFHILTEEMLDLNNYTNLTDHKIYVRKRLPSLAMRHSLILQAVAKLNRLYSVTIGVDFGFNSVCICLLFFLSSQELFKYIALAVYCFLAFFLYCFLCQRLTNAAEKFESAVYSCGWENFNLREQKMVYIMLMQAQKPVIIMAADNIPVNMYTFATTLQLMYKFVTVVK